MKWLLKSTAILLLMAFFGCSASRTAIYLPNDEKFADNEDDFFELVKRDGSYRNVEELLRILLAERREDQPPPLSAPFDPGSVASSSSVEASSRLEDYLRSARIVDSVVVLEFEPESMAYLNGTVSMQAIIKGSIEKTLKLHYPEISGFSYVVGGKEIVDWDA